MRISKKAQAIADAHIQARIENTFTNPTVTTKEELYEMIVKGETFSELMREIETRYCSIGSIIDAYLISHTSTNYKKGIYKGFKLIIDEQI